jgi:formylglycine-generating enzyme required for sulfatase activity
MSVISMAIKTKAPRSDNLLNDFIKSPIIRSAGRWKKAQRDDMYFDILGFNFVDKKTHESVWFGVTGMHYMRAPRYVFFLLLIFLIGASRNSQDFNSIIKTTTGSSWIGQGNPEVTKHPVTKEQCLQKMKDNKITFENSSYEAICGDKYMAPLYDPKTQSPKDAKACIDQFEYPNIPCEYPVVWVRADEAAKICEAVGKRICDAHEWEGACEGALLEPDYDWSLKGKGDGDTIKKRRLQHNARIQKSWAFGDTDKKGICAANSTKDNGCNGGDWQRCGSNTYPSGYFTECKSKLDVYDQHGNAAEHMNLPVTKEQMASLGSKTLGHTEMKGSWFIFDKYKAHQDHCRWRAPYWHGSALRSPKSHRNYHLGFRCCKSL